MKMNVVIEEKKLTLNNLTTNSVISDIFISFEPDFKFFPQK